MSWYRQYRPTSIQGLHLSAVRDSLAQVLQTGIVPHAMLLTGPKGTGKTSTARILAAVLNDPANAAVVQTNLLEGQNKPQPLHEPNLKDETVQRIFHGSSTVVFELDAASNRGIDDIRLLKERVMLPPVEGLVSVYILDEVHMLTIEAFNALLKLLEEPPAHAVFILATTELHKVPETIVSRCRVIQFQKASAKELTAALTHILNQEKIESEKGAVELIAAHADGSFRDGVKTLEALANGHSQVRLTEVENFFHTQAALGPAQLVQVILAKDEKKAVAFFEQLRQLDSDPLFFYKSFLSYLHDQLLAILATGTAAESLLNLKQLQFLLAQFNGVMTAQPEAFPFLSLELKTLELILKAHDQGSEKKEIPAAKPEVKKPTKAAVARVETNPLAVQEGAVVESLQNVEPVAVLEKIEVEAAASSQWQELPSSDRALTAAGDGQQLLSHWEDFLGQMKTKNSSIEALLRSARPILGEPGKARIEVFYQFHKETLQQPKFMAMIDECVSLIAGGKVRLEVELAKQAQAGAHLSSVSGQVNQEDGLIQLAKEILV
jgi:DNA polymerase-3 subunit gamma/tau